MRVGILGGGQLAQMLGLAGIPLGIQFTCLESQPNCSASRVARILTEDFSESAVQQLVNMSDVLTFESENIPINCLNNFSGLIHPSLQALKITQDRLLEKQFIQKLGIPVANFYSVENKQDLENAVDVLGFPCVLKTRRQGYDGKGQYIIRSKEDVTLAFNALIQSHYDLIVESWIYFDREVSLIAVRSRQGEIKFYPLTENIHQAGILRLSKAPFLDDVLEKKAQEYLHTIMDDLNYVGVLTVEFFVVEKELLINEIAPRVHNSGHWTIEGAKTSQFENHLRAILNLPLGETEAIGFSAMLNFIGHIPPLEMLLKIPSVHVHLYGKTPKIARKLGHLTRVSNQLFSKQESEFLLSLMKDSKNI